MINLTEISNQDFIDLAANHFDVLNPTDGRGNLLNDSLIMKLVDYQDKLEDQDEIDIIDFLLGPNFDHIFKIVLGNPHQLNEIINDFENQFDPSLISINRGNTADLTNFGKELKKIFDYDSYRSSATCVAVLKSLDFISSRACPYCNIDTIEIINYEDQKTDEEKEKALLDLDHFAPRCRFPFLALSFYNLVPSCTKCNQSFKSQLDFRITTHIHPFHVAFDDYFAFSTDIPLIKGMQPNDFRMAYTKKNSYVFPTNSIENLKLIERLETKKEDIMRFFNAISRFNHGANTANEIAKDTNTTQYTIEEALMDFGVTNNRNDIHKKVLSKVYRDIFSNLS